ncbi:MAG: hypothetical protein AAF708_02710 [Deinococcota bacterium]
MSDQIPSDHNDTSVNTSSNHVHNEHHANEHHNNEETMSATTLGTWWDTLNTRQLVLRSKQGEPFLTVPFKVLLIAAAVALIMPWLIIPSVVIGSIIFMVRNVRLKFETDVNTPSDLAS